MTRANFRNFFLFPFEKLLRWREMSSVTPNIVVIEYIKLNVLDFYCLKLLFVYSFTVYYQSRPSHLFIRMSCFRHANQL